MIFEEKRREKFWYRVETLACKAFPWGFRIPKSSRKPQKTLYCGNMEQKNCAHPLPRVRQLDAMAIVLGAINNTISGPRVVKNFSFDKICTPEWIGHWGKAIISQPPLYAQCHHHCHHHHHHHYFIYCTIVIMKLRISISKCANLTSCGNLAPVHQISPETAMAWKPLWRFCWWW